MGRQGEKRRKPARHLPKVQGNPGELHQGVPSAITYDGLEHHVGRAGPKAQAQYFRSNPGALLFVRVVGILLLLAAVGIVLSILVTG
jgi:hypothetical protein